MENGTDKGFYEILGEEIMIKIKNIFYTLWCIGHMQH